MAGLGFLVVILGLGAFVLYFVNKESLNSVQMLNSIQTMNAHDAGLNHSGWIGRTVIVSRDPKADDDGNGLIPLTEVGKDSLPIVVSSFRAVIKGYEEKFPGVHEWQLYILDGEAAGKTMGLVSSSNNILTPVK